MPMRVPALLRAFFFILITHQVGFQFFLVGVAMRRPKVPLCCCQSENPLYSTVARERKSWRVQGQMTPILRRLYGIVFDLFSRW